MTTENTSDAPAESTSDAPQGKITPTSTITEVFDFLTGAAEPGSAVQVVPITFRETEKDTRLSIFIKGERETASYIMAELVTTIQNLFEQQQQQEARAELLGADGEAIDGGKSRIITPGA